MKKNDSERAVRIITALKEQYPSVKIALDFSNAFELLIATILSAQCTDVRINLVTKTLFQKYTKPDDFLKVPVEELEKDIFSTGFYKAKAKSIRACCLELVEKYNSKVPKDFDLLKELPGVGRKTASVVAGNAFGIPAIAVDTHVKRLSNLLGFVNNDNPEKIEEALKLIIPEKDWIILSHLLATHGRAVCLARKPDCKNCVIAELCPSAKL